MSAKDAPGIIRPSLQPLIVSALIPLLLKLSSKYYDLFFGILLPKLRLLSDLVALNLHSRFRPLCYSNNTFVAHSYRQVLWQMHVVYDISIFCFICFLLAIRMNYIRKLMCWVRQYPPVPIVLLWGLLQWVNPLQPSVRSAGQSFFSLLLCCCSSNGCNVGLLWFVLG
jgi:hypothetical protein